MSANRPALGRVATLDILRLASALAVVFFHYFFRGQAAGTVFNQGYPSIAPIAMYGYLGIIQFFLISGFVIAWSAEGRTWHEFAIARFARLYPGFIACMTLTFVVTALASQTIYEASLPQYLANFIMFAPVLGQPFMDGVYWTIILELIFYGWVAVAVFFDVFERWKMPLIGAWLAIIALNEFIVGNDAVRQLFLTEFGPYFIAGILIHHIFAHGRTNTVMVLFALAVVFSCFTLQNGRAYMLEHYNGQAVPLPALIAANIAIYGVMIAAVYWRDSVKSTGMVIMLGGLTYPLYLLHQHIGYIAINAFSPVTGNWVAATLTIAIMLIVSWLIWRFIETPSRRKIVKTLSPIASSAVATWRVRYSSQGAQ